MQAIEEQEEIRAKVRSGYAEVATKGVSCCSTSTCCKKKSGSDVAVAHASALGYTSDDLKDLPEGSNMGLSCGNPTAIASLTEGEVVLDLGSGGGFDVFVAARKIGPTGKSIGVDMTPEMVSKARKNAVGFSERTGLENVEFRLGEIEHLPVADSSVDVIISNCVINLSPDKEQVWKEIQRVLKPSGRACISDIALLKPLPACLRESVHALVGCVAGAVLIDDTIAMAKQVGLQVDEYQTESSIFDFKESSENELYKKIMETVPEGQKVSDYVTSLKLIARKPGAT